MIAATCSAFRFAVAALPLLPNSTCTCTWQSWHRANRLCGSYIRCALSARLNASSTGLTWCTSVAAVISPLCSHSWQQGCAVSVSRLSLSHLPVCISCWYSLSFAIVLLVVVVYTSAVHYYAAIALSLYPCQIAKHTVYVLPIIFRYIILTPSRGFHTVYQYMAESYHKLAEVLKAVRLFQLCKSVVGLRIYRYVYTLAVTHFAVYFLSK